jgi:hypothetical protein
MTSAASSGLVCKDAGEKFTSAELPRGVKLESGWGMIKKPKDEKKDDKKRNNALKNMLKTPPKPHKPKD